MYLKAPECIIVALCCVTSLMPSLPPILPPHVLSCSKPPRWHCPLSLRSGQTREKHLAVNRRDAEPSAFLQRTLAAEESHPRHP